MPDTRSPYRDWQQTDLRRQYAYSRPGVHTAYKDYSMPEARRRNWPWIVLMVAGLLIGLASCWGVSL